MSANSNEYKTVKFREYAKFRKLADWEEGPPGIPRDANNLRRKLCRRTCQVLELMFPDFRPVYDRLDSQGIL